MTSYTEIDQTPAPNIDGHEPVRMTWNAWHTVRHYIGPFLRELRDPATPRGFFMFGPRGYRATLSEPNTHGDRTLDVALAGERAPVFVSLFNLGQAEYKPAPVRRGEPVRPFLEI